MILLLPQITPHKHAFLRVLPAVRSDIGQYPACSKHGLHVQCPAEYPNRSVQSRPHQPPPEQPRPGIDKLPQILLPERQSPHHIPLSLQKLRRIRGHSVAGTYTRNHSAPPCSHAS